MDNYNIGIQKERFFMLGFTLWKRHFIKPFFNAKDNEIIFLNSLKSLCKISASKLFCFKFS